MAATFPFQHGESALQASLNLPMQISNAFSNAPRSFSYSGALPSDWKQRYFSMFLSHAADREVVQGLLASFKSLVASAGNDALLEIATSFVQTAIAYDYKTAYQLSGGKIHYPSETLHDRKGVCADKTILLAALLQGLGYRIAILSWDRANHMALGVAVPSTQGNFGEYAMIETTAPTPIGIVPDRYAGGIKLDGKPEVTAMGGSLVYQGLAAQRAQAQQLAQAYGADYLKMPPAQQVVYRQMHPLKAEIEALAQQLKACKGNLAPAQYASCQQLNTQHNQKVEAYNQLVADFNRAGKS